MYIVELTTREGPIAERYETYAEARGRVEQFPEKALVGLPLIFRELADGSQRAVRDDGKPLQFHRVFAEDMPGTTDEPLTLAEPPAEALGPDGRVPITDLRAPEAPPDEDDEPIPLHD